MKLQLKYWGTVLSCQVSTTDILYKKDSLKYGNTNNKYAKNISIDLRLVCVCCCVTNIKS